MRQQLWPIRPIPNIESPRMLVCLGMYAQSQREFSATPVTRQNLLHHEGAMLVEEA